MPFKNKLPVGTRVRWNSRSVPNLPAGSLGTVVEPDRECTSGAANVYVRFDDVKGYSSAGCGWYLMLNDDLTVEENAPACPGRRVCTCPIKDLMTFGHTSTCPERKTT